MTSHLQEMYASKALRYRVFGEQRIIDGYSGSDGVHPASSNIQIDPVFGRLSPTVSASSLVPKTLGTPIGNMTAMGGLPSVFDGNKVQAVAGSSNSNPSLQAGWVGKDFGSKAQKVTHANVYGTSDYGLDTAGSFTSVTLQLYAKNGAVPTGGTDGILLGTTYTTDANGIVRSVLSSDVETAFQYVWVYVSSGTFSYVSVAELDIFAPGSANAMTIITKSVQADAQPDMIAVAMLARPIEPCALNTDLVAEVSRDNGMTWVPVVLQQQALLGPDRYISSAPASISGPSGADVCARITTPTSKNIDIRGLSISWS